MFSTPSLKQHLILPKEYCQYIFGKESLEGSPNTWMCSVCKRQLKCNVASSGYTNLYSHLKLKYPGFARIYAEAVGPNSKSAPLNAWFDPKATNIFNWIEWLIMDEHEFTFVESQLTRKNSTLKPISVQTIKLYCFKLVKAATCVERYGWPAVQHCVRWLVQRFHAFARNVCLFLPNVCKGSGEAVMWLLAFAPMLDETSFDAATHYEFNLETLKWYGQSDASIESGSFV
ncbi:hypothetical protein AaE_012983 [Aphanomyces astaci]|uniref:BED-type domain-containing protein n=1 Tax=Aphanomyces astaci TaxID=112090 RepID=A0A6A4ZEP0_APHAT|nr:hypothetical protein AaE_012983 [Aphanomyces astaci]